MSMYQPGALREFLRQLGVEPKKGLSQNFLIDGNILRKIVALTTIDPERLIVEIGSGPGALTEVLLAAGAKVLAIEKDGIMARELERLQTPDKRLQILCSDILDVDLVDLIGHGKKAEIIANLPYHITTPILVKLIPLFDSISRIIVMVQDEVGRRITAKASEEDYSSLSVFSNFYADPSYAFKVSRNCFYPVPKVDSAVVIFDLHQSLLTNPADIDGFFKLTRTAFGHRRKMMRSSLKEFYSSDLMTEMLQKLNLNPLARPEELGIDQFLALYEMLKNNNK